MQNLYIPSDNSYKRLQSLVQGFLIEHNQDGVPALLIKLEASLLQSIIAGCSMDIVIRNPHIDRRSVTLYINDSKTHCFFLLGRNFSGPDEGYNDFDEAVVKVATSNSLWVALYNELTMPVFHVLLTTNADKFSFEQWLNQVYSNENYRHIQRSVDGYYNPETIYTGFPIRINNADHTHVDKETAMYYAGDFRNPELDGETYNFNDYVGDGKHGYNQEVSIKYFLSRFFVLSEEVYVSPLNANGTEFTDFVVLLENTALLIESKYILSEKSTKLFNALSKAIHQLNRAQAMVSSGSLSLEDKELENRLLSKEACFKVCLHNDRITLRENSCKTIIQNFSKVELPFFIPVSTFYQMLGILQIKDGEDLKGNLEYNLAKFYDEYLSSTLGMLILRRLKVEEEMW